MKNKYSFCENVHAAPLSRWHIRKLTDEGRKLGGGADTLSLCEKQVHWDLRVGLTKFHLANNACLQCLKKFDEEMKTNRDKEDNQCHHFTSA